MANETQSLQSSALDKSANLDNWFHTVFTESENSTINLSRFGLKSSLDLVKFLRSPAGESKLGEIGTELAIQEKIRQNFEEATLEEQLLRHRILAYFAHRAASRKARDTQELYDEYEAQDKKALDEQAKTMTKDKKHEPLELYDVLDRYEAMILDLTDRLAKNSKDEAELLDNISNVLEKTTKLTTKYDVYGDALNESTPSFYENTETNDEDIQKKIDQLTTEIDRLADSVNDLLIQDRDEEARELLNKQNALNLQVGMLKDLQAVKGTSKQQKYFADENGHPIDNRSQGNTPQPTPFKESAFVLTVGEKLIKQPDGYYLLKQGEDWNTVKDNPERKEQARQHYERSKHEIMNVKNVVEANRKLEFRFVYDEAEDLNNKLQQNQSEKRALKLQLVQIQVAKTQVQRLLDQPELRPDAPKPKPTATAKSDLAKNTTLDYKSRLAGALPGQAPVPPALGPLPNPQSPVTPSPEPNPHDTKPKFR